jgi:hypothetical protein
MEEGKSSKKRCKLPTAACRFTQEEVSLCKTIWGKTAAYRAKAAVRYRLKREDGNPNDALFVRLTPTASPDGTDR